jgi:hypothetical protein
MRGWATSVVVVAALIGCSEKPRQAKRLTRQGDAAPVVLVDREVRRDVRLADEVEPNNTTAEAAALAVGAGVRGTLLSPADVDLYRLEGFETEILDVRLTGVEDADVALDIRDKDGKVLFYSDRGPKNVDEGLPNVPVEAGQVLYLAVTEFVPKKRKRRKKKKKNAEERTGPSKEYELSVAKARAPKLEEEFEPNTDLDNARQLMLSDIGKGYLGWFGDVDLWKVSLHAFKEHNGLNVDVSGLPGLRLSVEVTDREGEVLVSRKGAKGQDVFLRNIKVNPVQEFHVVRVTSKRSHPKEMYSVRATSSPLVEGGEREPNDSAATAVQLRSDLKITSGTANGFLGAADVDYWQLSAPKLDSVLNVTLECPATMDGELIVRSGGGELAKANSGKFGASERANGLEISAGKSIIVVVKGSFEGNSAMPYSLKWALEEATVGWGEPSDELPPSE